MSLSRSSSVARAVLSNEYNGTAPLLSILCLPERLDTLVSVVSVSTEWVISMVSWFQELYTCDFESRVAQLITSLKCCSAAAKSMSGEVWSLRVQDER